MGYYGVEVHASSSSLSHHGILGQKWGKRNGPPYPLGESSHTSAEKTAAKKGFSESSKESGYKPIAKNKKNGTVYTVHQNGSVTYTRPISKTSKAVSKSLDQTVKTKNGHISPAEDTINKLSRINQETSNIVRNTGNFQAKSKAKSTASSMSDDELRAALNRLNMEKQYAQLTAENTSSGRATVQEVLNTTGSVLAIAGSVVSIAAAVKALMG